MAHSRRDFFVNDQPLLRVTDISKVFGATTALSDVTLDIHAGTIHSLLGRNGAGKSTLVNVIAGIYPPSTGAVLFEGKDIRDLNIFERQELGIRLVPQHENSFVDLTVAENIFVGVLPKRNGLVDWKTINAEAEAELKEYGLHVEPGDLVSELSSIDARKLNIIRAMHHGSKLIILDEPTTALTSREREELFSFIADLKRQGTAFIFISHYLGEVRALSDYITVLRDGLMFPAGDKSEWTEEHLAQLVAGEAVPLARRQAGPSVTRDVSFQVQDISTAHLKSVSLDIHHGEILGIIGFPGSGAREFCRTLFGLHPIVSGKFLREGEPLRVRSPREAISQGIAYISFDRHREGIIPTFDVNDNLGISVLYSKIKLPFGFVNLAKQRRLSMQSKEDLKIKCNTIQDPIESLSGGNQQKVIVSRLLATEPQLLILDEPTIGIDIKSREEIISKLNELSRSGMSTIYLTNDYEELLRVADRLAFFEGGQLMELIDNDGVTIEQVTEIRDRAKEMVHE